MPDETFLSTLLTAKRCHLSSSAHGRPGTFSLPSLLKRGFTPTLKPINQFLLFLCKLRRFQFAVHFFCQLDSNKIRGNSQSHSILAWALLKLHKFEEAEQLMKTQILKTSDFPISCLWGSLIQGFCINRKDPEKALFRLRDCLHSQGILPSPFTFSSLIHSFSSQGNMSKAIEVLELMAGDNVKYPLDNFICSSVISGLCMIGKLELAMGFFENSLSSGVLRPNVVTYTAVVSALSMQGRANEVGDLVCRMQMEGLALDVIFYSSWICGLIREGNLLDAFRKYGQMMRDGVTPDAVSYTILIDGFSKEGNVEKAVGFLTKMIRAGVRPTLVTYTTIMLGFCKKQKMEEAIMVFKLVGELGIKVDELMYATLIDGVCRTGDIASAFSLMDKMEMEGFKPSIVTYNTLINGLCKVGRTSDAEEVSKWIVGDIVTYSTLLHGYIEEENIEGIVKIKKRFEESRVAMDVIMCNILLKALVMLGSLEDAYALFEAMPKMDLIPDSVTYCTIIDGYHRAGRIENALEIFDVFRRESLSSVACYNCIIHGLCKKGMIDMATQVFAELHEKGFISDAGTCIMLTRSTFANEGASGVLNFVYRLENVGPVPFGIICNSAIYFLCKRGYVDAASKVFIAMRRTGSVATTKSYYLILRSILGEGKLFLAGPLLNIFLKEHGLCQPIISKILVHYLCLKDVNNALEFIKMTKSSNLSVKVPVIVFKKLINADRVLDAYKLVMGSEDNLPAMDVVDYTIIIDGLRKSRYIDKALDLCTFAKNKGISLDIITYNSVIHGLCQQGCFVEAFRVFDSLERIHLAPSEITYATLIDSLCKEGLLLDAKRLFERMTLKGLKPHTHVYNSLINCYCKFGQTEEAMKLLHDLEMKCLKPDEFTVTSVIWGYFQKGDMEGALGFFFQYKRKDVLPDLLGYLYLIRGLYTKGRMEEARSIIREMLLSKSVLDLINRVDTEVESESLKSFLVFLCEQGSIQQAIAVLNEIGDIFFPAQKWCSNLHLAQTSNKLARETSASVTSIYALSHEKTALGCKQSINKKAEKVVEDYDKLGKRFRVPEFGLLYSHIASLCSNGELQKANGLIKEMLSGLKSDG